MSESGQFTYADLECWRTGELIEEILRLQEVIEGKK